VAKQLLDRAEVGAALQQVGGKGVAQGVGRDSARQGGLAHPAPQPAAHVGARQATSPPGEEERIGVGVALERGTRGHQIAIEGALRRLADRDEPRLLTLAQDAQHLRVEVGITGVEHDDLLAAEPAGVRELEHRPVADLERRSGRDSLEQRLHLPTP
jgi:hypothetical protein